MSNDRSADALSAAAAFAIARSLYPSAIELVEYLLDHDNAEIRADLDRALATAARARERLRELAADRLGADGAAVSEQIDALEIELDAERRKSVELESQVNEREAAADAETERLREQFNEMEVVRQRDLDELRAQLQDAHNDRAQRERELAEANEERHRIQLKLDTYDALIQDGRAVAADPSDGYDGPPSPTISGVIDIARQECEQVVIPDAAPREIEDLESDEKAGDWARELWKALRALNAYAGEAEFFNGGFWEWCEHTNNPFAWPATPKKLAMSESDSVMQDGRLRRTRRFLIDTAVEPRGYVHMEAHLKISEGGGQHIPRLYFHDDSKGRTSKIHVGFIGPHRLVPNTQG